MSLGSEVDALMAALQAAYTTRFAERANTAGDITIVVAPPDIDDFGYGADIPCPPGLRDLSGGVLIESATASGAGARDLLDIIDALVPVIHAAGWTPLRGTAVDVEDRPGYLLAIEKKGTTP